MLGTHEEPRYRDIMTLGHGGMATVTLAEDTLLLRRVALKRLRRSSDRRELARHRREALLGASLNHRNLVAVYDVQGGEDSELVIVMEYVAGETLREVIGREGSLPPAEALRILSGLAAGLDALHDRGIVHRDVKPANVLLGREGTVKLADLGIAAVADHTESTAGSAVAGTFSYMAPEQLEGCTAHPTVDVYALSAVAFEMLCGRRAHPESNVVAIARAIATMPAPDLRERWRAAPERAARLLQLGLSEEPALRPASAGALVQQLREALTPHIAHASAPTRRLPAPARRHQMPTLRLRAHLPSKPHGGRPTAPTVAARPALMPPAWRTRGLVRASRARDGSRTASGGDRQGALRSDRVRGAGALAMTLAFVAVLWTGAAELGSVGSRGTPGGVPPRQASVESTKVAAPRQASPAAIPHLAPSVLPPRSGWASGSPVAATTSANSRAGAPEQPRCVAAWTQTCAGAAKQSTATRPPVSSPINTQGWTDSAPAASHSGSTHDSVGSGTAWVSARGGT
jgi:tRNA A-37 threonylcarbamoyl transferase component Bud32